MSTMSEPARLTLAMLAGRTLGTTMCPSEVARALIDESNVCEVGKAGWRARMPDVHAAVDALIAEGHIALSWKGAPLDRRDGPYRIALRKHDVE